MSVIEEIAAERERQKNVEGWTPEHDDEHNAGEMALAAACYAVYGSLPSDHNREDSCWAERVIGELWPLAWSAWWKPKTKRRDLVRAAALIVAEIERLDRARAREATQ